MASLPPLVAELIAKTDGFQAELKRATQSAEASATQITGSFSKVNAALGALGVGFSAAALIALVHKTTDLGDQLYKMSQRVGVSVESLSTLRYAADLAGIGMDDLDSLLVKLNKKLGEAGAGSAEAGGFLKQFGINVADIKAGTLGTDEALKRIADTFANSPDGINKTAAATEAFGKAGAKMVPFLNQGREAIEALQAEATKLGLKLSTEAAKQAEEFNDALRTMEFASEGARNAIVGKMLPALTDIARAMRDATIEGGKLKGLLAGLQTALTGGDQFKNDKALVELTEKKLALEAKFAKGRNSPAVGFFKAELDAVEAQIRTTLVYRKTLEEVAVAEKEAAARRDKAKSGGKQLALPDKSGGGARAAKLESDPGKYVDSVFKSSLDDLNDLNKLLAGTPIEKTRVFQDNIEQLNRAFFNGAISAQLYDQAITLVTGKVGDANKEFEALREAGAKVFLEVRTPLEVFNARVAELNTLLMAGTISFETYERAGAKAFEALADKGDSEFKRLEDAIRGWGNQFTNTLAEAVLGGELSFKKLADSIIRDLVRIQIQKNITDPLVKAGTGLLDGLFKGGGGPQQLSGPSDGGGLFGSIKSLLGFAEGGSFRVGGSGGVDSQLVAFRASPDETVSIARPGQGGGASVVVANTYHIDARSDIASIQQMLRRSEEQTKAAVLQSLVRGGTFAQAVRGA